MRIVRLLILKILKISAIDIVIKHHYTGFKFHLNSYNHKGYWYFGEKREKDTVNLFNTWISEGDYVLEIGGHIGYFSTLYAKIVGINGKVDVFEPSEKNISYLAKNIDELPSALHDIVKIIKSGAGDVDGDLDFYIDPITGQNNSFVENFEGFYENRKYSIESNTELTKERVAVLRLDTYFQESTNYPNFVKIDVEGFEWNVVKGFMETIEKHHPSLMIEIQADADKIIPFFLEKKYSIFNDKTQRIYTILDYHKIKTPNIFFRYK